MLAIADTHALIWYLDDDPDLSESAQIEFDRAIQRGDPIGVATITVVEIIYLVEKGRISNQLLQDMQTALADPRSVIQLAPLTSTVALATGRVPRAAVKDPFDRIIVATALALGLPLITRDARIVSSGVVPTLW